MWIDSRRCSWCGRLCRYYGEDQWHNCSRCQLWHIRNGYCQSKNALCSERKVTNRLAMEVFCGPQIWPRVLDMVCGRARELDKAVQAEIWLRVLWGPIPRYHLARTNLLDALDPEFWIPWVTPPGTSKLFKFWMLELTTGCRELKRVYINGPGLHARILCVIIAFLPPFSEFGLDDGIRWKRGPLRERR